MLRTIITSLLAVAALLLVAAGGPSFITLAWDYDEQDLSTNLTFKVYQSTDVSIPLQQWTVLTNVVGTNLKVRIPVIKGKQYFAMTASNMWGESDFSEVLATPPLPRSTNALRVILVE